MIEQNLEFLKRMAKGIVSVFGNRCEVVIHDFTIYNYLKEVRAK